VINIDQSIFVLLIVNFNLFIENGREQKMNVIENAEKECAVLGSLFQGIVNEMKVSTNKS
jgi:hypothetical protein